MTAGSDAMTGPPVGQSSLLERLGSYPCAALVFDDDGRLVAANQQASDLHIGIDQSQTLREFADKVEVSGKTLTAVELQELIRSSKCIQYQQHVNGTRPPRWLLCQAAKVPVPGTSSDVTMLIQLDITDSKKRQLELEQVEARLQEQMQAQQRKLVRVVTENEALHHVVDKLQSIVLMLRRQLQRAGLKPEVALDEEMLRPSPHQDIYSAMLSGLGISGSDGDQEEDAITMDAYLTAGATNVTGQTEASWPSQPGQAAGLPLAKLASTQASLDAAAYKAKYEKFEKAAADATCLKAGYDKLTVDSAELKAAYDKLVVDTALQQAQLDKATADAAEYKAGYDKLLVDSAEHKAQYDKDAVVQQAQFEKLTADAAELKAGYDKYAADAAEYKAGYDKLLVDTQEQQAYVDKLEADNWEQQAQLDKAAADAAEYKAGFDKLLVDSAEQQAQLEKAAADAVEFKAGFDKLMVDSAEHKAQYDRDAAVQQAYVEKLTADAAELKAGYDKYAADAAEYKAGYDKLLVDSTEQNAQYDRDAEVAQAYAEKLTADAAELKAGYDKYAADAAEYKAGYDKLLVDSTEQKAQYDKDAAAQQAQYAKLTADAAELKAGYDKLTADNFEQQAQLDKAAADAAEYKAGYDKLLVDSAEEKAQYDKDADAQQAYVEKLTADAAELKAGYDKYAADAAEYKAGLDKLTVDNVEQQAYVDKLTADAAELKAGYDKYAADAAEYKAGYDKLLVDSTEQKAQYDKDAAAQQAQFSKLTADAAEYKAGYDKLLVDSAEQQAQLDKAAADAAEYKAGYDKYAADAAEYKAGYDKLLVDTVEQQAVIDKAEADAFEMKAGFDKLLVDSAEQKAQYDKASADAAEFKAGYDKLLVDTVEQQSQLDKAAADAAEYKAGYDKYAADAAEYKAGLDKVSADAAEYKAGFDKLLVDSAEQKAQYDKVTADAAEYKAGFDKLMVDTAEQQAQLDKATADAAEYKAGFDKLLVDSAEHKAQLDKATADAAEYKAGFDKYAADAAEYKAGLDKASADAAEFKAGFDKLVVDSAEQKAQLDKVAADAAEFKAGYDKLTVDTVEQRAQLDKAAADAAEYKAGYDKYAADAAEYKAGLDKVTADAAEYKAGFDKLTVDSAEQKAQLDKVTADAAEYKAGFDKAAADAAEFKAGFDKAVADGMEQQAEFEKLTADAAELKADFDKLAVDTTEQKAQLDKATADAAEFKAGYDKYAADAAEFKAGMDKATADAAEFKAGFDKVAADAAEFKAGYDKVTADAAEYKAQMSRLAEDMSHVQEQLVKERENYSALHDQHAQLMRQQEVLAAELMVALGNYKPKANIDSGTPADKLLQMITDLLDGSLPNLEDILLIQSSILEARDIYQPWRLGKQLLETKDLEENVGASLVYLLGDTETLQQNAQAPQPVSLQDLCSRKGTPCISPSASSNELAEAGGEVGLLGMLSNICASSSSQGLGLRPGRHMGNRRRSSSMSARLAAMPEIYELDDGYGRSGDQQMAAGRASQMLQQLAMRRGDQSVTLRQLGSAAGNVGVGASAAAMLHQYTNQQAQTTDGSSPSTSEEDVEQSSDTSEYDSTISGPAGPASESACGSQLTVDGSIVSLKHMARPQPPVVMDQLEVVLASAYEWQFDAFSLNEASQGHPLSTLGYYLFHKQGLIEHFNLKPTSLARFLRRMEEGYRSNPYHNAMHAADVLQTYHVIINRGGMVPGYVDPIHMMACCTAAVMHDFEHGGLTNDFLVNSLDNLAVLYNDRSPLENHHLAAAFMIMRQPEFNFIGSLSKADFEKFRKIVIELVLATDMKQHFSILSHFTTVHRLNTAGGSMTPGTSGSDPMIALRQPGRSEGSNSANSSVLSEKIVLPLDENERILGLQMALKCADVGHVTAALPVHIKWVNQLEEEFFRQGDVERQNGMTISPLFDRAKQGITKSQVGFFDIVIIPLFHTFGKVFGNCRLLLTYVMRNYRYWAEVQAQAIEGGAKVGSPQNRKTKSRAPSPLGHSK